MKSMKDIDEKCEDSDFPCLAESHLPGREFSCEAFINKGKVRFLNITEYVHLGYSNFIPEGHYLNSKRELIHKHVQKLVDIFGIEYGMVHPEWFLTENDELNFGETELNGLKFNILSNSWSLSSDCSVNYIIVAKKN